MQALERDAAVMAADAPRLEAEAVQLTQQLQQEEKVCSGARYLGHGVTGLACNQNQQKHADIQVQSGWRPSACAGMQELARLQEGVKGELEGYRRQLSALRAEQAPWEAQLAEVNGRVAVAAAERDLLLKKQADAEKRLKAGSATRQHADLMPMCQSNTSSNQQCTTSSAYVTEQQLTQIVQEWQRLSIMHSARNH